MTGHSDPSVMQLVLSLAPGGTERLAIDIVTRLSPRMPMVVCCLDEPGAWAQSVIDRGVPVVTLGRRPGFHPELGRQVARVAATHGITVVHCHHYSPFVYGAIASLFRRSLRLVFTEHGRLSDAAPTRKRRMANTLLARVPASTFAVSASLKAHMVAEGFLADRVGVIHNGIEAGVCPSAADRIAARRLLDLPPDAFVVGTAARLDPVKDLPALIAAMSMLRQRETGAHLVIVGDGPERPVVEAAIRESGLQPFVHLLGYRADVRQLLPGFDVYANSSVSEGVSLTILEAMAAALPVVATRVGGTPEVVADGSTGQLVPARDPQALAEALASLVRAADRRRAFGAAGRARLEASFTIDRMVADYAREYARPGRS